MLKKDAMPKIWQFTESAKNGGAWSAVNRPDSGARYEGELPVGNNPLQLYSLGTPNGIKVTIMLEELLALGYQEAEYDAFYINILQGEQFSSGFVKLNPNSKIPVLVDTVTHDTIFESSAILLYLAEKFAAFLPKDRKEYLAAMNWLFWSHGSAPMVGGGFGHFFTYAPEYFAYPLNRYTMETKRLLDVLDTRLRDNQFLAGSEYSIADIAAFPWYGNLLLDKIYAGANEFLNGAQYKNIARWSKDITARTAVIRGSVVGRTKDGFIKERHSAQDIDLLLAKKG